MNKPIVKNWMRYWASTLAVSGMLVMSSCGDNDRRVADDNTGLDRENVTNTTVAEDDMAMETDVDGTRMDQPAGTTATDATTTNTSSTQANSNTATVSQDQSPASASQDQSSTATSSTSKRWNGSSQSQWRSGSSVANIDRHIQKHSEVNDAIRETLSEMSQEDINASLAQQGDAQYNRNSQNMSDAGNMQSSDQSGVSYDNMSNRSENADVDAQADVDVDVNAEGTNASAGVSGTAGTYGAQGNADAGINTEGQQDVDAEVDVDADANVAADVDADVDADAQTGEVSETIQTSDYQTTNWGNTSGENRADDTDVNNPEETGNIDTNANTQGLNTNNQAGATTTQSNTQTDNMASDQSGVTYDNMSNTNAAAEDRQYSSVYDPYLDESMELSDQERQMIDDARRDYEARRMSMMVVEARPDVNISELIEEIKEETRLPKELEDAKMEGTVLVKFEVDDQGAISNAEVIDGFISQTKEDGSLMSYIRLSDRTQSEIAEEINKEDLLEFKGEDRDKIIEAVTQESLRVVESTSGKWQPSQQNGNVDGQSTDQAQAGEPQKAIMVMPIRFDIED